MPLIKHLSSIISISEQLNKALTEIAIKKTFTKGGLIINYQERCDRIYFINKGLVRGFYYDDGKEITHWFAQEQEFATSFYSFITSNPSLEYVQALEDTEVIEISYNDLQKLYSSFQETERLGRIITETYYIKLEERILNLQFKTAKERYQKLLSSKSTLLQRVSLGQIAAYLGITQETLSRIRTEL
jgi:CRP-like cAMP-binding protein